MLWRRVVWWKLISVSEECIVSMLSVDGVSKFLWNVNKFLSDKMTSLPRRRKWQVISLWVTDHNPVARRVVLRRRWPHLWVICTTRWFKYDRDWFFFCNRNCSSLYQLPDRTEQVLTRAGGRVEVVASLSQGRTADAQCGLFTHKSVPVIFEPLCI